MVLQQVVKIFTSILFIFIVFSVRAYAATPEHQYDVNGDGMPDSLIAELASGPTPAAPGTVWIQSGSDGTPLWSVAGSTLYDYFGYATSFIGDLNGDGIPDVAVGVPLSSEEGSLGRVDIYSGADGSLLHTLYGQSGDTFGLRVEPHADVNGDGIPDVFVAAHFSDQRRNVYEIEYVFSGADGALLSVQADSVGRLVKLASDVDGDGVVTPLDVSIVAEQIGVILEDGDLNPADVDADGHVDIADMVAVIEDLGESVGEHGFEPVLPRLDTPPAGGLDPLPYTIDGPSIPPIGGGGNDGSSGIGGGGGGGSWQDGEDDDGSNSGPTGASNGSDDDSSCDASVSLSPVLHWLSYAQQPEPMHITFTAHGSPTGGSYSWSVSGASYRRDPDHANIIHIKITRPGRVTVKVRYTKDGCTRTREVRFFAFHADIDVDSSNTKGFGMPDGSPAEELIEDDPAAGPGKIVFTSIYDTDGDGVPDYADGLGFDWADSLPGDVEFVPVRVLIGKLPDEIEYKVRFTYDASDPMQLTRVRPSPELPDAYAYVLPSEGRLRLWRRPGHMQRNPSSDLENGGDFIAPGIEYDTADLGMDEGGVAILWLEAVRPSEAIAQDRIQMDLIVEGDHPEPPIPASLLTDAVRVTATEIQIRDLLAWGPTLVNWNDLDASGLRLIRTDFLDQNIKQSAVDGAITDGVSGVLVRLYPPVGEYLDSAVQIIKKESSTFHDYPRGFGGFAPAQELLPVLPVPSASTLVCGIEINNSVVFYFPPEAYLDPSFPEYLPPANITLSDAEVTPMVFRIESDAGTLGRVDFVLRRPPVLLAHGLRSGPDAWSPDIWKPEILKTKIYKLNYEQTNEDGYDYNYYRIGGMIDFILDDYRHGKIDGKRYAASRIDYVGHSMGGVLARLFVSDARAVHAERKEGHNAIRLNRPHGLVGGYLRYDNWYAGYFRRFISIGSPFRGSRWAIDAEAALKAAVVADEGKEVWRHFRQDPLLTVGSLFNPQPAAGLTLPRWWKIPDAIIDLQPNSKMQQLMDNANYPGGIRKTKWHPIVCVATDSVDPGFVRSIIWNGFFEVLGGVTIVGISEANGLNGDLVVRKSSQVNGQSETIGYPILPRTVHTGADILNARFGTQFRDQLASPDVVQRVHRLLSTDRNQDWQGSLKP